MMKLSHIKTHWSAEDAILVMEFLESLKESIAASYAEDIERWYQAMTLDNASEAKARRSSTSDSSVPF